MYWDPIPLAICVVFEIGGGDGITDIPTIIPNSRAPTSAKQNSLNHSRKRFLATTFYSCTCYSILSFVARFLHPQCRPFTYYTIFAPVIQQYNSPAFVFSYAPFSSEYYVRFPSNTIQG